MSDVITSQSPTASAASTMGAAHVRRPLVRALVVEARPRHWVKNVLLFAGIVFAKQLTNVSALWHAGAAFVVFCVVASSIYYINDLADYKADAQHPKKRHRPIAAGEIPVPLAWGIALVGIAVALPVAFALQPVFGAIVAVYVVLQFAYTYWLKEQVLLDVFGLAASYVLRVMGGALVIGVPISPWLYVCTVLFSLMLGFAKRRHELVLMADGAVATRPVLAEYSATLLEEIIAILTSATVMAYALYTFNAENLPKNHAMMFTIPFVLYAVFRYLYLVYRKSEGGDPVEALFADRPLLICIALWGLSSISILYLGT